MENGFKNEVEVLFIMATFLGALLHFFFSTAPQCHPDNCHLR